jgi:hypothetical protein
VIKTTIERYWWDRIRNPETIRSLLQLVYARPSTIDDTLLERIVEVGTATAAAAAAAALSATAPWRSPIAQHVAYVLCTCCASLCSSPGDPFGVFAF